MKGCYILNTKKINPIAYFIITWLFGCLGVHHFIDGKVGKGILYLFTGGLFGIGYLIDLVKSFIAIFNKPDRVPEPLNYTFDKPELLPEPADGEKDCDFPYLSWCHGDEYAAYVYEKEICCIDNKVPKLANCGGKELTFVQEPENEYDSSAVAIYLDEQKLGYVYRGKTQDMINDWKRKDWYFIGIVNKYSSVKITYKIAFYKPLEKMLKRKYKTTSLNEFLPYYNKDDDLDFECDYEKERYIILDDAGEKIGTNYALYKYADENDLSVMCMKVLNISDDDNGNCTLEYNVYFSSKKIWRI